MHIYLVSQFSGVSKHGIAHDLTTRTYELKLVRNWEMKKDTKHVSSHEIHGNETSVSL